MFGQINVLNLLEFIGYYRTNGINRIVLYYYDFDDVDGQNRESDIFASPTSSFFRSRASTFLQFLSTSIEGVELHRFVLPKTGPHNIQPNIHAGGQILTMHHCLHRYPDSVQIHVDIDEFVFVQYQKNQKFELNVTLSIRQWIDYHLSNQHQPSYVALYIPSVLHCHEFNLDHSEYYEFTNNNIDIDNKESNDSIQKHCSIEQRNECEIRMKNRFYLTLNRETVKKALMLPNNIRCQQTVWKHEIRSKVVLLQPRLVHHLGVHNVWKFNSIQFNFSSPIPGVEIITRIGQKLLSLFINNIENLPYTLIVPYLNVDPSEAILRHYRWCCQIKQSYFFDFLNFYSVDDHVVTSSESKFENDLNKEDNSKKLKFKSNTINAINNNNTLNQMENFVLFHFREYLWKLSINNNDYSKTISIHNND